MKEVRRPYFEASEKRGRIGFLACRVSSTIINNVGFSLVKSNGPVAFVWRCCVCLNRSWLYLHSWDPSSVLQVKKTYACSALILVSA